MEKLAICCRIWTLFMGSSPKSSLLSTAAPLGGEAMVLRLFKLDGDMARRDETHMLSRPRHVQLKMSHQASSLRSPCNADADKALALQGSSRQQAAWARHLLRTDYQANPTQPPSMRRAINASAALGSEPNSLVRR